ncbi:MAG: hypothetical protein NC548_10750 [Lachnospiraceae bacterium]|nr:hypothetical protein [Lachnospiraceae bacterium]
MNDKAYTMEQGQNGDRANFVVNDIASIMCPSCGWFTTLSQNGHMSVTVPGKIHCDILIRPVYHAQCPKCLFSGDFITVDNDIAGVVSRLNNKGYITTGCCSGHGKRAYIKFRQDVVPTSTPDGWSRYTESIECSMLTRDNLLRLISWESTLPELPGRSDVLDIVKNMRLTLIEQGVY